MGKMTRRGFLGWLGFGAGAAAVAGPAILESLVPAKELEHGLWIDGERVEPVQEREEFNDWCRLPFSIDEHDPLVTVDGHGVFGEGDLLLVPDTSERMIVKRVAEVEEGQVLEVARGSVGSKAYPADGGTWVKRKLVDLNHGATNFLGEPVGGIFMGMGAVSHRGLTIGEGIRRENRRESRLRRLERAKRYRA
jgi:hypothetical protein